MQDVIGFGGGGGKGGGGGTRTPVESPDSLRSKAIARVLDLVSEGEVEGLVNGLQSVYLDDTPIQNADGSYNFNGVTIATRNGTQSQGYIPGFPSVENEVAVDVEIKVTQPVVRSIANLSVNAVRVRIMIPQLTYQDPSTGDLGGTSVQYAIDTQPNGGAWTEVVNQTTNGKTTSRYERQHRVELTGTGPWNIRVRRITADSTNSNLQNKTYLASYTEIVDAKLRYPNSALVALTVDSAQFRSIPRRGYLMKLLRIKVPTNYDPVARTYSGIWDGSFKIAWSDNPAWCFYDLLTNARYGLGDYLATSQIDKWSLYKIAQYCDGQVPNGFGGYEPRFTCNMYLQTRAEAYNVLQNMASVFRGMLYWQQGSITTVQDAPDDAVYLYTNANVIDGLFTYSGSSRKARHTVALVTWNDPADNYKSKVEYVEDVEGIKRFGVVQAEVTAVGCTSRGQANRVGKWILYSERMETEIVEFKTGLDGVIARPGQVIKIADQDKAGARIGGRLVGVASASSLTLDAPITMTSGATYFLSLVTPDGKVEERQLISSSGTFTNVTASTAFSFTPTTQTIWVMKSSVLEPAYFRVLSVAEGDNNTYAITAVAHEPSKFEAIENDLKLETRTTSVLSAVPGQISTINVSEYLYIAQGDVRTMMTVSWQAPTQAARYSVEYRKTNGGNWVMLPDTMSTSVDVPDVQVGSYQVRVRAISVVGLYGSYSSTVAYSVLGKTAPPSDVIQLALDITGNGVSATWGNCPDVDYATTELSWSNNFSNSISEKTSSHLFDWLPAGSHNLYARHVDTSGNLGNTASGTITIAPPGAPTSLRLGFGTSSVDASWRAPVVASDQQPLDRVELSWGSAFTSIIDGRKTTTTTFGWLPAGPHTLYARYVDMAGNVGAVSQATLQVLPPAQPVMTAVDTQVNLATLRWQDAKTSQPIRKYAIWYAEAGTPLADALLYGSAGADSRSDILQYRSSGAKVAYLVAEDVAGNVGAARQIDLNIKMPDNFILSTEYFEDWQTSELINGTIVGGAAGQIILPAFDGRTWAERLSNNGWTTAQQKIDAGFPIVMQPGPASGKHVERHDCGKVIAASVVRAKPTVARSVPGAVATIRIRASVGASTTDWQAWQVGDAAAFSGFQHVEVEYAVASDGKGFVVLDDLYVRVEVTEVTESATLVLNPADALGTPYVCTKPFLDVRAVQVTPVGLNSMARPPYYVVDDGTLPATIYVFAHDAANNRTGGTVSLFITGV